MTALGNITAPDDYIYAILTDEIPQLNAMDAIRDIYPNAMHLEYRNSHTKAIAEFSLDEKIDETGHRYFKNGKCMHDCESGYMEW